jgi:hypothetical protein
MKRYGPTFLIRGIFLLTSGILVALDWNKDAVFYFAVAVNDIQNGIVLIYTANLICCSLMAGASTNVALVLEQLV